MTPFVALLRGINVGRAKRVAMADLRSLLQRLGFSRVGTLLNSGNAVFTAAAANPSRHAARIQAALLADMGLQSQVFVKSAADIAAVVAGNGLGGVAAEPARVLVCFTRDAATLARLETLAQRDWSPEALHLGRQAAYAWCPRGSIDSPLMLALGKALGDGATTRNWATVGKIDALLRKLAG